MRLHSKLYAQQPAGAAPISSFDSDGNGPALTALLAAARRLLEAVQQAMIRHHDLDALGEPKVVQADASPLQPGHLFEQRSGLTTVPAPMMQRVAGLKMPDGARCSRNVPCSLTTVCPALSPPWKRITISARWAR